jgi:hypothetical protein
VDWISVDAVLILFADDRFIAKELSRAELQAMETFAPAYFDYMSSAVVAHVSRKGSHELLTLKFLLATHAPRKNLRLL